MSDATRPSDSLPGAPWIHRDGGRLMIESVAADELAERFGTPLYVYSRAAIEHTARAYMDAVGERAVALRYAVKANSNLAILQLLHRMGWGFDVVSGGELARVLAAGGDASRVVFSGVGKTDAEIRAALQAGVQCLNLESVSEVQRVDRVAAELGVVAPISLRINPDVDPRTHPYISTGLRSSKFGIAQAQARQAYAQCAQRAHLRVVGIDVHIGSQITDVGPYLDAVDRVLELVGDIERDGITLHHLDLGGGLGIRYADETPPTPRQWIDALCERLQSRGQGHRQVLLEPGRSVVGNAGALLCRVVTLKDTLEHHFAVVDAAMNDLMRPALYESWQRIEPARLRDGRHTRRYDVVGPVCESGDWLGRARDLDVAEGDVMAILSAGAYGMAMASNYNTRGRAAEVLVDGTQAQLIRERESLDDLLRGERLLER